MNRRHALQALATASTLPLLPGLEKKESQFKFALNTSTISRQKDGIEKYIEIAGRAGYDCIEIWIADVKAYLSKGGTLRALKKLLHDAKVEPVNAIGFATWMVEDDGQRQSGFKQMREEMAMMADIGCPRIAAPAAGVKTPNPDLFKAGERYLQLLEMGKAVGVVPQLEIWGSSVFHHLGQALMAVAVAGDSAGRILPDVYHLFRGGSGFESLQMIDGRLIEIFHMNDYPGNIPRERMEDKDRVYPGDGVAPLKDLVATLQEIGGNQIFSLELFNREYWKQDPLTVAKTGLEKMRAVVGDR